MNLFDLSLSLTGYDIASAKRELRKLDEQIREDYATYKEAKKEEILRFHLKNNPFYRQIAGEVNDWEQLPVLTKGHLQQPLKNRLSQGFTLRNCHIHKTSGSSGTPFIFAKDKYSHALSWASISNRYASAGINLKTSYEARFYGIPLNGRVYYQERLKDFLSNRYRFIIFDLSRKKMQDFVQLFIEKPFGHINGYTSTLVFFAHYLKENNLILKTICPSLAHCIVTAEMLFPEDALFLEKQFGVPVYNEYGSSETGILAFGKANQPLDIDHRLVYIEILDEDNRPVNMGESGKVVVTSLYNKAHPFIRYEIGDLAVLSKDSEGLPVLEKLEGRSSDFAVLPDGKMVPGLAFYYITKTVIADASAVKEFVVQQIGPEVFEIHYVADQDFDSKSISKITEALEKYVGSGLRLVFKKESALQRTSRGKLKQFTRIN